MGSRLGAEQVAAKRLGVTVEEWRRRRDAGEKWCHECSAWHPVSAFAADKSRGDGLKAICRRCSSARGGRGYQLGLGLTQRGRRFVAGRDGDKLQARRRVNHLVDMGLLPRPADVPCVDCGHQGDDRRHEYDHHLGYAVEHHEHVEPVCAPCHHEREKLRQSAVTGPTVGLGG